MAKVGKGSKAYNRAYKSALEYAKRGETAYFKGTRSAGTKAVAKKYGINIKTGKYLDEPEIVKQKQKENITLTKPTVSDINVKEFIKAQGDLGLPTIYYSSNTIWTGHMEFPENDKLAAWIDEKLPDDIKVGEEAADIQMQVINGVRDIPIIGWYTKLLEHLDTKGRILAYKHFYNKYPNVQKWSSRPKYPEVGTFIYKDALYVTTVGGWWSGEPTIAKFDYTREYVRGADQPKDLIIIDSGTLHLRENTIEGTPLGWYGANPV